MKRQLYLCLVAVMALLAVGCGKVVPPGHTVLILKPKGEPIQKNEGVYYAWGRDRVYFISTKLKSYEQEMQVLCADEINMDVRLKWLGSFKVSAETIPTIKQKVPAKPATVEDADGFELSLDQFYDDAIEDVLANIAKDVISPNKTDNIREKRRELREEIRTKFLERMKELNYPIETADVLITNLEHPPEVTTKRKRIKDAELQDIENAAIAKAEVAKAERDAELEAQKGLAALVAANAEAAANYALAASLTPEIIRMREIEAMQRLALGPNNTALLMPYGAMEGNSSLAAAAIVNQGVTELSSTMMDPVAAKARRDAAEKKAKELLETNNNLLSDIRMKQAERDLAREKLEKAD